MDWGSTGIADITDLETVKKLLIDNREKLMPSAPRRPKGVRTKSDEWQDALSAWDEQCEMIDELTERFGKFVEFVKASRHD